jgi:hypothetical protein
MPTLRRFATLVMLAACLVFVGADAPAPAVPDFAKRLPEFKSGEPVFAFNGKDLNGWYTFLHEEKYGDPNHVFSVQDGMLRISGQGYGGITTKQTFKDYHLVTEWKWGEKTWDVPNPKAKGAFFRRATASRDAGILVHGVGEDGAYGGHWLESVEVQLIEGGVGDFILVGGKASPSLTVESRVEGEQLTSSPADNRSRRTPAASTGGAATRSGPTRWAIAVPATSKALTVSGTVSKSCATATASPRSSTATSSTPAASPATPKERSNSRRKPRRYSFAKWKYDRL